MSKIIKKILIIGAVITGLWAFSLTAFAAEFEVTNDNVRIREQPNTSSTVVGSANRQDSFTIESETTDSAGNVWYRVNVEGNTYGYIRSDLGRVTGEVSGVGAGAVPDIEGAEPIPAREATISQSSVRVRTGPSTSHAAVDSLGRGTVIILTAEATDASGRTWYYMTANTGGQQVAGFVRSDLIAIGDLIDIGEGAFDDGDTQLADSDEDGESPQNEHEFSGFNEEYNFEIRYIMNEEGGHDYFLFDRAQGTQWKIDDFLELRSVAETNERLYQEQSRRERAIIIVLAVVIVILVLVLTVLIFKIRDISEDMEADSVMRPLRPQSKGGSKTRSGPRLQDGSGGESRRSGSLSTPGSRSQGTARPSETEGQGAKTRKGQGNARPRPEKEKAELKAGESNPERPEGNGLKKSETPPPKQAPSPRKPQNFLTDDDEFEFEFLNIDD